MILNVHLLKALQYSCTKKPYGKIAQDKALCQNGRNGAEMASRTIAISLGGLTGSFRCVRTESPLVYDWQKERGVAGQLNRE